MSDTAVQQPAADVSSPLHSEDFRTFLEHRKQHGNVPTAPAATQETETAETSDPSEETSAAAETAGTQQDETAEGEEPKPAKNKNTPVADRIASYQKRAKEAERIAEERQTRIAELEQKLNGGKPEAAAKPASAATAEGKPAKPEAPKLKDFDSYDAFHEATEKYLASLPDYYEQLSDWQQGQRDARRQQEAAAAKQRETATAVNKAWADRETQGREKYEDYDEIAHSKDLPISDGMAAAIMESELGHEIAYYLGSHPEEAKRIAKLPVASQIRELGKIEAKFSTEASPATTKPAVSKAPPPGKPVRAGTTPKVDHDKVIATSTNFREVVQAAKAKQAARAIR